MSCTRSHFTNAGPQHVCLSPSGFYLLPASPTNAVHIVKRKRLAILAMPIDVPIRDPDLDRHCRIKFQIVGKRFYTALKVFAPLAADIVCYDDARELGACKRREDYIVHVAIPNILIEFVRQIKRKRTHLSPFCRSPAPFLRTRQCLGQTQRPTPVTLYPGVHLTTARTSASCSD